MRSAVLRYLSTHTERVLYRSTSNREAWLSLSITSLGLGTMTGVAYYQQVPGMPYLAGFLGLAAVLHVGNSFKLTKLKAVEIAVVEEGKVQIVLANGSKFEALTEKLKLADEAEIPNDFKLLRQVKTSEGREFYVSYGAEMSEEGRKLLKMP